MVCMVSLALCLVLATSLQSGVETPPPTSPNEECEFEEIDPFSDEVMEHVRDYDPLQCPSLGLDIETYDGHMHFTSKGKDNVGSMVIKRILSDGSIGDVINEKTTKPLDNGNTTGAIQCRLNQVCLIPEDYDPKDPPLEIQMVFTSKNCKSESAQFAFTMDGLIRHQLTNMCLGPLGGWSTSGAVADKTILALRDNCESKFNILHGGVLHLIGANKCIHPYNGGNPKNGEKVGLYKTCTMQERLFYHWFLDKNMVKSHSIISTEMAYVKVNLDNDAVRTQYIDYYALSVIKKTQESPARASMTKPNVLVICIEEASAQNFQRKMRLTEAMMANMNFLEYKKHSANSPIAGADVMNLILGHSMKNTNSTVNSIFEEAKSNGYVTFFSAEDPESVSGVSTKLADVDHNSLPFFKLLKNKHQLGCGGSCCYCLTGNPIYNITFNYLHSFMRSYSMQPKLAVILFSEVCREYYDNLAYIGYIDQSLVTLLEYIKTLKNTVVFVTSLKGGTTKALERLPQGRTEIKRPILAAYVSEDLVEKYLFEDTRAGQLSTVLDVHMTLRHIISSNNSDHDYGVSLLKETHARDCKKAGVDSKVCPCAGQGT